MSPRKVCSCSANLPTTHAKDWEEIDIDGELAKQDIHLESETDVVNDNIPRCND